MTGESSAPSTIPHELLSEHITEYIDIVRQIADADGLNQMEALDMAKKVTHDRAGRVLKRELRESVSTWRHLAACSPCCCRCGWIRRGSSASTAIAESDSRPAAPGRLRPLRFRGDELRIVSDSGEQARGLALLDFFRHLLNTELQGGHDSVAERVGRAAGRGSRILGKRALPTRSAMRISCDSSTLRGSRASSTRNSSRRSRRTSKSRGSTPAEWTSSACTIAATTMHRSRLAAASSDRFFMHNDYFSVNAHQLVVFLGEPQSRDRAGATPANRHRRRAARLARGRALQRDHRRGRRGCRDAEPWPCGLWCARSTALWPRPK